MTAPCTSHSGDMESGALLRRYQVSVFWMPSDVRPNEWAIRKNAKTPISGGFKRGTSQRGSEPLALVLWSDLGMHEQDRAAAKLVRCEAGDVIPHSNFEAALLPIVADGHIHRFSV